MRAWTLLTIAALAVGCSDAEPGPVAFPPAIAPGAAFASTSILVVSSEETGENLAVLALDLATGELGQLPGSPANVGVGITDVESLAADPARRRVFFGSNLNGAIAVCDLDANGVPDSVSGSPFAAEHPGVSVVKPSPAGNMIYVGYHAQSTLSRYDVAADGTLTLAQSIPAGPSSHVETMLLIGDVLYVGFEQGSNIIGYRLDANGAFQTDGQGSPTIVTNTTTNARPDYLATTNGRLYCSLANDGSVDAFTIEADGSLTRIAGAPYTFPGITQFELIAVQPGGAHIAVGAEKPSAAVGLYTVNGDGSLTPAGEPLVVHERAGGPEGMAFSADGRFLYVCDHIGQGLYVFEISGSQIMFAATPRYALPGKQIDVIRLDIAVGNAP